MTLPRALRPLLWIFLIGFSLLGVFDHSLWGPNDSREAGMISEMRREHVYAATVLNHEVILEKPPLAQWTALAFCAVAGRIDEGLVRLPSALYGLGTLILLYMLIRRRHRPGGSANGAHGPEAGARGPEAGAHDATAEIGAWSAVLLCAGSAEFWEYARVVLTDMTLAFMVMLSLYLFWRAWEIGESRPATASAWRWAAFLLAAALAFYAKGLIGPGFVWCGVGSFLVWRRRWRLLVTLGLVYAVVLAAAVAPWAAALYRTGGREALHVAFWDNQVGRFLNFSDRSLPHDPYFVHKEPIYYYLVKLPIFLMPWTLLLIPALIAWWKRSTPFREPVHVYLRAVCFGMLLLLHVAAAKVGSYALPVFPFLFAMTGIWLADAAARPRMTRLAALCSALTVVFAAVALCGAPLALVAAYFRRPDLVRAAGAGGIRLLGLAAIAFLIAVAGVVAVVRARRGPARAWALPLAPGLALCAFSALWVAVLPVLEAHRTYAPIVDLTRREMSAGRMPALYRGDQRWLGALAFYLDRPIPTVPINTLAAYMSSSEPRAVIVPRDDEEFRQEALPAGEPAAVLTPAIPGQKGNAFAIYLNAAAAAAR